MRSNARASWPISSEPASTTGSVKFPAAMRSAAVSSRRMRWASRTAPAYPKRSANPNATPPAMNTLRCTTDTVRSWSCSDAERSTTECPIGYATSA